MEYLRKVWLKKVIPAGGVAVEIFTPIGSHVKIPRTKISKKTEKWSGDTVDSYFSTKSAVNSLDGF